MALATGSSLILSESSQNIKDEVLKKRIYTYAEGVHEKKAA